MRYPLSHDRTHPVVLSYAEIRGIRWSAERFFFMRYVAAYGVFYFHTGFPLAGCG